MMRAATLVNIRGSGVLAQVWSSLGVQLCLDRRLSSSSGWENKKKQALEPNAPSARADETCLMHSPQGYQTTAHATELRIALHSSVVTSICPKSFVLSKI